MKRREFITLTARDQLVALANRHTVPAIYPFREDQL
jgi:hypothetical protein